MWGLILLGMSGGLIPCTDAIAMLVLAVGMNLFWLALPLLLAFSAGLAGVLVLVGVLVVKFRHFAGSRWGEGRLVRALPIVSAIMVTVMGFWLCYEAVQGQ
jgi:nickel/cobalt exporter